MMLRQEIIGRENRSNYLSSNKNLVEDIVLSVYKACRHIFCIVSRRICLLHTSKELRPNHYNETFSTRNRYVIPAVWFTICSAYKLLGTLWTFFFPNIGLFAKNKVCHLILELFNLKKQAAVAEFITWSLHERLYLQNVKIHGKPYIYHQLSGQKLKCRRSGSWSFWMLV